MFTIAKIDSVNVHEWMKRLKKWNRTTMRYYSASQKKGNAVIWLNIQGIMLSEVSQLQKDKYYIFYQYEVSKITFPILLGVFQCTG